jgi:hypothetical protein
MLRILTGLACLCAAGAFAETSSRIEPGVVFESGNNRFFARHSRGSAIISPNGFLLQPLGSGSLEFHWSGATARRIDGDNPTGGHSNYGIGRNPAAWRTGVPH